MIGGAASTARGQGAAGFHGPKLGFELASILVLLACNRSGLNDCMQFEIGFDSGFSVSLSKGLYEEGGIQVLSTQRQSFKL